MATATVRPALGPAGKSRRPGIMVLLYVVTGGFYFLYWLYKTFQELRAHSPGCTALEPGSVVARAFIPFYNLYWFFKVMRELPRVIARVRRDSTGDGRMLDVRFVTRWYVTEIIAGNIACAMNMAAFPLFLGVHFYPLVAWQRILNAHWELVRKQGAQAANVPIPPVAPDPPPDQTLHEALGVAGRQLDWRAVWAFVLAMVAAFYFLKLLGEGWMNDRAIKDLPWILWFSSASYAALRAATIVFVFRRIRFNAAAAAIAAGGMFAGVATVWHWVIRGLGADTHGLSQGPLIGDLILPFVHVELLVVALVLGLRWFRPAWFAMWMGTLGWMVFNEILNGLSGATSFERLIKTSYSKGLWVVPFAFGFALTWHVARRFVPASWLAGGVLALVVLVPVGIGGYEAFRPKQLDFSISLTSDIAPASRFRFTVQGETGSDTGEYQAGSSVRLARPMAGKTSTSYGEQLLPEMSASVLYPCGWRPARVSTDFRIAERELRARIRTKTPVSLMVSIAAEARPDFVRLWVDNRLGSGKTRVALGADEREVPSWAPLRALTFPAPDCEAGAVVRIDGQEAGRLPVTTGALATTLSAVALADPASDTAPTRDYLVDPLATRCYALRQVPPGVPNAEQPRRSPKYPEKRFDRGGLHRLPPVNLDFMLGARQYVQPRYSGSPAPGRTWLIEVPCS